MKIKIGTAQVQNEQELPSLFNSPSTLQTPAEQLLAGLGDLSHFHRNNLDHDLILTTRNGVVIGHTVDAFGNQRVDLVMLNMGLVTQKQDSFKMGKVRLRGLLKGVEGFLLPPPRSMEDKENGRYELQMIREGPSIQEASTSLTESMVTTKPASPIDMGPPRHLQGDYYL